MHHSPNVLPVRALEEGVVHDLLHCLPDPVLRVTEEAVDEVLCLGGDRRELGGEDEVLAPVHDLVVCLCRRDGRGVRGGGEGEGEGGIWIYFLCHACLIHSSLLSGLKISMREEGGRFPLFSETINGSLCVRNALEFEIQTRMASITVLPPAWS